MVIWFLYKMQVGYRRSSRIVGSATSSVWKDPVFRSTVTERKFPATSRFTPKVTIFKLYSRNITAL